jgi:hypothetical protein
MARLLRVLSSRDDYLDQLVDVFRGNGFQVDLTA